jgi:hypothetical protein
MSATAILPRTSKQVKHLVLIVKGDAPALPRNEYLARADRCFSVARENHRVNYVPGVVSWLRGAAWNYREAGATQAAKLCMSEAKRLASA